MADPIDPAPTDTAPIALVPGAANKPLSPAAQRALAEAAERRAAIDAAAAQLPKEYNGRGGKEPVRYGDWEVGGIASDF